LTDTSDWLEDIRRIRAAGPRHLLFLCVANSARSQMAEAIARTLAPAGVRISSAGSAPSHVNPHAIRALSEIGIDASAQRSKGMDKIRADVDAVITLCAEEVCPAWLGNAATLRVHWPLPDPAAATGSEERIMASFRSVRDKLCSRLASLFEG